MVGPRNNKPDFKCILWRWRQLSFAFILMCGLSAEKAAWAAGADDIPDSAFEIGVNWGRTLPHQIDGVTEILETLGARMGIGLGWPTLELIGNYTQYEDISWVNFSMGVRLDLPFNGGLVGFAAGLDYHDLNNVGDSGDESTTFLGGHIATEGTVNVGDSLYFFARMQMNFEPGTSLNLLFGPIFRF